jgi:hypothetical protein
MSGGQVLRKEKLPNLPKYTLRFGGIEVGMGHERKD